MVKGLKLFVDHFKVYTDQFAVIGGTACFQMMESLGLVFRSTKDIDIVLFTENLSGEFVSKFWEFVHIGGYRIKEMETSQRKLHRFSDPVNIDFPFMLEFFSSKSDSLESDFSSHLTPIVLGDASASLSAIVLDVAYYHFIKDGRIVIKGLPILKPEYLIPLKIKAWLDLTKIRASNEFIIQSNDIKKHKSDVFKLAEIVDRDLNLNIDPSIKADIQQFIDLLTLNTHNSKEDQNQFITRINILKELYKI